VAKKRALNGTVPSTADAGDNFSDCRDSIHAAVTKQLKVFNKDSRLLTHAESMLLLGGIALPALCLRYLLHQDAFPLGRTLTLSGLFRSNKTSLAFEIARWILLHRGMAWYNDVEKKDSPDMRQALMNYDDNLLNYLEILPCSTQDQWQGGVTAQFDAISKISEKQGGRFTVPGVSIVDSVAAADPKAESDKFMTDHGGAGRRAHPAVALYNAKWMTEIVHYVSEGPFILLLIQHSSEVQDPRTPGITTRKQKGGMEMAFAKTTAFEMTRVGDIKETANAGGVNIKIECSKNALGPSRRQIKVPARWTWVFNEELNRKRQHYYWDWHHASIELLLNFSTMDGRKGQWKELSQVCDLHKVSGARVWSRTLGVPEASPVTFAEAGHMLEHEHSDLMPALYDILHIERRGILKPGHDLRAVWTGKVPVLAVPEPPPYPRQLGGAADADGEDATDE
jgi:hypothetical protein